jgi:hypothetical protein
MRTGGHAAVVGIGRAKFGDDFRLCLLGDECGEVVEVLEVGVKGVDKEGYTPVDSVVAAVSEVFVFIPACMTALE